MRIFRHLADIPATLKGAVLAIGNFDGVHRGHQALIERARALAEERNAPLAVMVFEPTPQEYFNPGAAPFRITPFHAKARVLAELGVDALFAPAFDANLARQSAQDFILTTLLGQLGVGAVVVGRDFRFGTGRAGDATMLAYMGGEEGFFADIVDSVPAGLSGAEKISSTAIRQALALGQVDVAAHWLGRPFAIEGTVEHGDKRGRTLGFPTANIGMGVYVRPAFGVYAVRVSLFGENGTLRRFDGVANLGIRPMYKTPTPLLEAFLFDFDEEIYGRRLSVELVRHLRPEMKFASVDLLVEQMTKDKAMARMVLAGPASTGSALDRNGAAC